jgi:hypothetical protein
MIWITGPSTLSPNPQPNRKEVAVIAARTAILAVALAAGAACQAQAVNRAATSTQPQPPASNPPAARHLPTQFCQPHYEWGGPTSQRPQRPDDIYVYYVDIQCHKTLVRVIHNPKRLVKVTH